MKLRSSSRVSYLPEDLMINIIRRLPVECLMRFSFVNKSWYRFITSPCFIKSTITNTNNNDRYLLSTYRDNYTLTREGEEFTDGQYYYTPDLFGININYFPYYNQLKVYGICNGLLCVSDSNLLNTSSIYLWNPIIGKVKKISMMRPARVDVHWSGYQHDADLCFGYFHDDYKVVKIVRSRGGKYRVGVYSLSTNAWKVTYCDSDCGTYSMMRNESSNKFVGGVAYFGVADYEKYKSNLIAFILIHKRIRNVQFPDDDFGWLSDPFSLEPCGESIALFKYMPTHLTKWVLTNCAASTWEKIITINLEPLTPHLYPLGFTKNGKYLLRDNFGGEYLWDFGISQLEECTSYTGTEDPFAMAIDSLLGNLVLLDEKTLDPTVEIGPCSTRTTCVLYVAPPYRLPSTRIKKRTDMLDFTQYTMHGRTYMKIGETEMKKPRKRGGKDMLDNTPNRSQGRGTKRRKQETEFGKPRKRGRKEMSDRMQNVLPGRGAKRRMEETEMVKPRNKGRKELICKTQNILQRCMGGKKKEGLDRNGETKEEGNKRNAKLNTEQIARKEDNKEYIRDRNAETKL